jgi:hypothetical protein
MNELAKHRRAKHSHPVASLSIVMILKPMWLIPAVLTLMGIGRIYRMNGISTLYPIHRGTAAPCRTYVAIHNPESVAVLKP